MFRLTRLSNGLRVVSEPMPSLRSVAVGLWIDAGTRDETATESGAAHFLEHLLFKGSERIGAREISERFDAIGAEANAFTTKEATCFWVRLLDDDLPEGLALIAEMVQRPAFRAGDIEAERRVVIEEINMTEDDPADLAHEQFFGAVFAGHPLERPVLGERRAVAGLGAATLRSFWRRRYRANGAVLAAAGSVDHERLVALAEAHFGEWPEADGRRMLQRPLATSEVRVVSRESEQVHLVVGGQAFPRSDERRYALAVLDHIVGGSASSRLFHAIREERGLAYSVYTFGASFADAGAFGVYAGTTAANVPTLLEVLDGELSRLRRDGLTDAEIKRAKGGLRGSIALALEDPTSRMVRLGREELAGMDHLSVDERLRRLDAVGAAEVMDIVEILLDRPRVAGVVGPYAQADVKELL